MTYDSNYQSPNVPFAPRVSRMAVTAVVLSIVGVATSCLLIGIPVVIVGMILGIVALLKISSRPMEFGGKGYALAAIIIGAVGSVVVLPLSIAILLPSLGRAREMANRVYCAANMRGLVQCMNVYAADNQDCFPVVMAGATPGAYTMAQGLAGNTNALADPSMKLMYSKAGLGSSPCAGSVTACWWLLVLRNQASPNQFICKSDPVASGTPAAVSDAGGVFYLDFQNTSQFSYSSAYPWNAAGGSPMPVGGWWKSTTDSGLPVMADMAPLNGTGSRPVEATAGAGMGPVNGNAKSWNSNNHQREGQNVAFSDGHAEFLRRPDAGPNRDNIWTQNRTGGPAQNGTPLSAGSVTSGYGISAASAEAAWGRATPFDVVMVPTADVGTGERK